MHRGPYRRTAYRPPAEGHQVQVTPRQASGAPLDLLPPPSTTVPGTAKIPYAALPLARLSATVIMLPAAEAICAPSATAPPRWSVRPEGSKPLWRNRLLPIVIVG